MRELPCKGPSIYDVAAAAGVAPSTVSRTFGRPGRVRSETAEHVRQVAADLGYHARTASTYDLARQSRLLALVVADIANPFYGQIARGAQSAATDAGYVLLLVDSQESEDLERRMLSSVVAAIDGMILASSRMSDESIRMTAKQRPVVVLNREVSDVACVVTDSPAGVQGIVRHLIALGHRNITYLRGPVTSWADGVRWRTLLELAHRDGFRAQHLGPFPPTVEGGQMAGQRFNPAHSTAVIAYNDQIAIGFALEMRRQGVAVPEEVSVVGFDNIPASALVATPISTVAAPLRELGIRAVHALIDQVKASHRDSSARIVLPTRLVIRASSSRARAKPQ